MNAWVEQHGVEGDMPISPLAMRSACLTEEDVISPGQNDQRHLFGQLKVT